jgi:ABC-type transport system involved in multi-copper enzyme maturation permease subunit
MTMTSPTPVHPRSPHVLTRLRRLVAEDLFKLRRQRIAQITVGFPILIAAAWPQCVRALGIPGAQGYGVLLASLEHALLIFSFLFLGQASVSLAAERADGTLREIVAGPFRRRDILLARFLALGLELILGSILVVAAAYVSTRTCWPLEDIRADAVEPLFFAEEIDRELRLALLYHLPPSIALLALGLLISVLAPGPAALATGGLLVLDFAKSILERSGAISEYLFNSYLPTLFDRTSYLRGAAALADGVGDVIWSADASRHALVIPVSLGTLAFCLAAALAIFHREDIAS